MRKFKVSYQRIALIITLLVVLGVSSWGFRALSDNAAYLKISKSLAIFGEFFRQVSNNYVDEIDPAEFIEAGIEGMVKHLDPYTSYIADEDNEEVDIITTGVYGGLGITTALLDSAVTIVGITEGCSAEKAGMRVGDKIYAIDSTIVMNASSDELRKFTRGKPGTSLTVRILRSGVRDTLRISLQRQEVTLKNVTFYGLTNNDIGYIRLERFTHNAPAEVRDALIALQKQATDKKTSLRGLTLDLRENPGGLLDAAVGICELFVPQGTQIVSTRGRAADSERRYYSRRPPLEPTLPLAILINDNTASASEIVAGALQDLDRAVVVGERSFGKGLVQTISSLPYDATLKMTTAKYYTPSGRCIQKIDYNDRRHGIVKSNADTNKTFKTQNGRTVRDVSGIMPDTVVVVGAQADIVDELLKRSTVFTFANEYTGNRSSLPENFTVDKRIFDQFVGYAKRSKFTYESPAFRKLNDLEKLLKTSPNQAGSQSVITHITAAKNQLAKEQTLELERQREIVSFVLYEEILERFYPRSLVIGKTLNHDIDITTAAAILHNPQRYKMMLRQPQ
ncbi:MAG: S41 family peptidase [Candidatus Kapabacteria bacterium]|jgi:carboxyl-terminal processing protease|nr:S41 family peptidase [Candidatus Kapabacteria bacterium]